MPPRPGDATPGTAVDIGDIGPLAQLRLAQAGEIAAVVALLALTLEQHDQPVIEAEFGKVRALSVLLIGFSHAGELQQRFC